MAFNGSGVFVRLYNWTNDAAANIKIRADRMDNETNGIATGLSTCITKDGQTTITANLPMATFRHTGVGAGAARTDYTRLDQSQDGKLAWADAGGTADAITATYSIPITTLVDGQLCYVRAGAANATTTPTFSPSALTARTIVKNGGSALVAGDIAGDGHELELRYDLANTRWELMNPKAPAIAASLTDLSTKWTPASASGSASLGFAEDTDNGTNKVTLAAPSSIAADVTITLPGTADTLVGRDTTDTLTNKSLTTPTINQGNLVGTTTNDSAAAGSVGEYVESIVLTGAATSLTTATAKTVTSISLTAGDWDVSGFIGFNTGGTTTTTVIAGGISTTNNTLPSPNDTSCFQLQCSFVTNAFNQQPCGMKRISIASTTTVYLVATSTFATSTCAAWGTIRARRVR